MSATAPLVLYGGGGLADELAWLVQAFAAYRFAGFVVSDASHLPIRRPDQRWGYEIDLLAQVSPPAVVLAMGQPAHRHAVLQRLLAQGGVPLPSLVHPSAAVAPDLVMGRGCFVGPFAVLTTQVQLHDGVFVHHHCSIGHDCVLGSATVLMPGARLSGGVHLEACVQVGAGAVVLPGIRVGARAVVGAGAVVTKDVPAGETWAGVPARRLDAAGSAT